MRILLTVPDTIGDFVMRQPLFEALRGRGHALSIVLQRFLTPLAPLVAPGAALFPVDENPYSPEFERVADLRLEGLTELLRQNRPDLVAVTPYQWTGLDERIVSAVAPAASVGLSGYRYRGSIELGEDWKAGVRFTQVVPVREEESEFRKNEALCRGILNEPDLRLGPPRLEWGGGIEEAARRRLAQLSLEPGRYWVACAGHNQWTVVKNWDLAAWAKVCGGLIEAGMKILFVGTPDEDGAVREILAKLGEQSAACVDLCEAPPALDLLAGLIGLSAGYVGKDTGPMHIAAATGRPVVAVFGGGHWPRFVPEATRGEVLTQAMPCAGCNWVCHFAQSHCVKGVPVDKVEAAVRRVMAGEEGFRVTEMGADAARMSEFTAEAAAEARERMRQSNRELTEMRSETGRLNGLLAEVRERAEERAAELEAGLAAAERESAELRQAVMDLRRRKLDLEVEAREEKRRVDALLKESEKLKAAVGSMLEDCAEAETRAAASEERAAESQARAEESEVRATESEAQAAESEARATEREARATESDARATEREARAMESEARAVASEQRAAASEQQAEASARSAAASAEEARVLKDRVEELERQAAEAARAREQGERVAAEQRERLMADKAALEERARHLSGEVDGLRTLTDSVRRSVFTRLLRGLGIWKLRF